MLRRVTLFLSLICLFAACSKAAQNSTGKALDNANELIQGGSGKVWGESNATNTVDAVEEEEERNES